MSLLFHFENLHFQKETFTDAAAPPSTPVTIYSDVGGTVP